MLKLLIDNLGTIAVLIVLGLVIFWAVRELRSDRVSCTTCPIGKHCNKAKHKQLIV
ncbi:MAG: hypothetical protein IJJ30_00590 [Erysipelotrichaceae bacterium]|nr:hypothetical protein [Erysipelotrichaceae bacterium]